MKRDKKSKPKLAIKKGKKSADKFKIGDKVILAKPLVKNLRSKDPNPHRHTVCNITVK